MNLVIRKEQFEKLADICGCDCWNDGHIVRQCLKVCPDAMRIEVPYRGTGLFVDALIYRPHCAKPIKYRVMG